MKRVLVIDDEYDIRQAVGEALRDEGYDVLCACDGAEGLERLRQEHPNLVLLDLMMPRMDGWQFRAQQKSDPDVASIPVVVVSALGPDASIEAASYLQKPFDLDQLLDTVAQYATADGQTWAATPAPSGEA